MPTRDEIDAHLGDVLSRYPNVPANVARSLMGVESGGNPNARSPKNAYGLMQLMPATAAEMGVDPTDWRQNVEGGVKYLAKNLERFGGDLTKAVAAYHAGPGAVERAGGVPNTHDGLTSTPNYVARVLGRAGAATPAARSLPAAPADEWRDAGEWAYGMGNRRELPPLAEAEKPGFWEDTKNRFYSGVLGLAEDARELARLALGDRVIGKIDEWDKAATGKTLDERRAETDAAMSPEMAEALRKEWWDDEKGAFGPAATDWRSWYGGLMESLPGTVAIMLPAYRIGTAVEGASLAKAGLTKAAARELRQKAAQGVALTAAENAGLGALKTASVAGASAAGLAGKIIEGLQGGAGTARNVGAQVLAAPDEVLDQSEAFRALLEQHGGDRAAARRELAGDQRTLAFAVAGVVTGIFGGAGDQFLFQILRREISGPVWQRIAKGVVSEGLLEEFPQSFGSRVAENVAMQAVDPSRPTLQGALGEGIGGAAVGALMGGGMGAAFGRNAARPDTATQPPAEPPPPAAGGPAEGGPAEVAPPTLEDDRQRIAREAGIEPLEPPAAAEGFPVGFGQETAPEAQPDPPAGQDEVLSPTPVEFTPEPPAEIGRKSDGQPFKSRQAANMALITQALTETHEVAKVGEDAYLLRRKAPQSAVPSTAIAAPEIPAEQAQIAQDAGIQPTVPPAAPEAPGIPPPVDSAPQPASAPASDTAAEMSPTPVAWSSDTIGRVSDGKPFKSPQAAKLALIRQGLGDSHEVAKVGDSAYVLRRRVAQPAAEKESPPVPPETFSQTAEQPPAAPIAESRQAPAPSEPGDTSAAPGSTPQGAAPDDAPVFSRSDEIVKREIGGKVVGGRGMTRKDLMSMVQNMRRLIRNGMAAKDWYIDSAKSILDAVGSDMVTAERLAQMLSITSSGNTVKANFTIFQKAIDQYMKGEPIRISKPEINDKLRDLLYFGRDWDGKKTNDFYVNLVARMRGEIPNRPVIDRHQFELSFGKGVKSGSDQQYNLAARMVQAVAKAFNIASDQAQAAMWVAKKAEEIFLENRFSARGGSLKSKYDNMSDLELYKLAWDEAKTSYADLIKEKKFTLPAGFFGKLDDVFAKTEPEVRNVTVEAIPAKETELGGKALALTEWADRQRLTKQMLADVFGVKEGGIDFDSFLSAFGLNGTQWRVELGAGSFEGKVNPNVVFQIKADSALVERVAKAWQAIWRQAAAPFFRADVKLLEDANAPVGVWLRLDRELTPAQERLFYDNLRKKTGGDFTRLGSSEYAIINFRGADGKPFSGMDDHAFVKAIADDVVPYISATVTTHAFGAETYYEEHDAQNQLERTALRDAAAGGSPALRSRLDGWIARFDAAAARQLEQLDQPPALHRYSDGAGTADARAGRGSGPGTGEGGLRDGGTTPRAPDQRGQALVPSGYPQPRIGPKTPRFNLRPVQPGAVTITGIHYGNAGNLPELTGGHYGQGAKGEEAARLQADPALRKRVYFYAQHAGIPPAEGMVTGPHVYRTVLTNVLDVRSARGQELIKATPKIMGARDMNAFEQSVIAAGFDGYVIPEGSMRDMAVVLGSHVEVEYLGTRQQVVAMPALARQRPIPPEVEVANFEKWSGGIENVIEDASPSAQTNGNLKTGVPFVARVYHGSPTGLEGDEFRGEHLGKNTGAPSGTLGFFAAGNPSTSEAYTTSMVGGWDEDADLPDLIEGDINWSDGDPALVFRPIEPRWLGSVENNDLRVVTLDGETFWNGSTFKPLSELQTDGDEITERIRVKRSSYQTGGEDAMLIGDKETMSYLTPTEKQQAAEYMQIINDAAEHNATVEEYGGTPVDVDSESIISHLIPDQRTALVSMWLEGVGMDPFRYSVAKEKDGTWVAKRYDSVLGAFKTRGQAEQAAQESFEADINSLRGDGESQVYDLYLKAKNPFVYDYKGRAYREESYYSVISKAKAAGHDAVVLTNTFDGGPKDNVFVFFDPNQVKSATENRGTYSTEDNNIYMRRGAGKGLAAARVRNYARDIMQGWRNAPELEVVQSVADLPFNAPDDAEGAYWRGTVYLVSDNLSNDLDIERTLFHEARGHYGLRGLLGNRLGGALTQIANRNQNIRAAAAKWKTNNARAKNQTQAAYDSLAIEEAMSDLAGTGQTFTGFKQFVAALQEGLRAIGLNKLADWLEKATDAQALQLLAQARTFVEQGEAGQTTDLVPAMAAPSLWRSQLREALATKAPYAKDGTIAADQLARWVEARSKDGTFKADEVTWTGLTDWLTTQKKVSRDDVSAFLDQNGVRVEETELGGDAPQPTKQLIYAVVSGVPWTMAINSRESVTSPESEYRKAVDAGTHRWEDGDGNALSHDEAADLAGQWERYWRNRRDNADTKFAQWQLPGGKNYRELLLTLPFKASDYQQFEARPVVRRIGDITRTGYAVFDADSSGDYGQIGPTYDNRADAEASARQYTEHAASKDQQILRRGGRATFTSSHFDQPNVLAHVRFNERTDADGKRVLFIEEIQSDWAQKGRKEGFKGPERTTLPTGYEAVQSGFTWRVLDPNGYNVATGDTREGVVRDALARIDNDTDAARFEGGRQVPAAPYVGKTEAWVALALKRMIRYAADNNFDAVAWTTGEQQADRYDLSKQIDMVQVDRRSNGMYDIAVQEKGNKHLTPVKENTTLTNLEDHIGKDLAEKVRDHFAGDRPNRRIEFTGLDLKVGGEGMRGFYDKILPSVANDLLKKLGGGRVGEIKIPLSLDGVDENHLERYESLDEVSTQPGLYLTDAIKAKAAEGMPLFARNQGSGPPPARFAQLPANVQDTLRKVGIGVQGVPLKDRALAAVADWQTKLQQGMLDQFASIKELDDKAYMLLRLTKSAEAPLEALLRYGKPFLNDAGAVDLRPEAGGLVGQLKPLIGKELDLFLAWVAGKRAEQLKAEGRENLLTDTDITNLVTLNQGTMDGGRPRAAAYAAAHAKLKEYMTAVLDLSEKAGILEPTHYQVVDAQGVVLSDHATDAQARAAAPPGATVQTRGRALWEKDFYVPFYRVLEDSGDVRGPKVAMSGVVNQKAFVRLKGGTQEINDLFQNTLRNWAHLLDASLKNQAATETLVASTYAGIARPIPESMAGKGDPFVLVDGKKQFFQVDDPLVAQALAALEKSPFTGAIPKMMGKFKFALTLGVTASPAFRVRNLIRDSIQALAANPVSYNIGKNLVEGWKGTKTSDPMYQKALTGGGFMHFGSGVENDLAHLTKRLIDGGVQGSTILDTESKVLDALKSAWQWWEDTGTRVENVNRASIYKQNYEAAQAAGKSEAEAHLIGVYAARDSMDFSSQGAWPAVRFLAQVVPFMNARLQGMYKLGRAGLAPTVRAGMALARGLPIAPEDKARAVRFNSVVAATAMASIALLLAYRDDEDWKRREEWDRDNFWWFKVGDLAYRIPKPFEVGALASVAERGLEAVMDGLGPVERARFGRRMLALVGDNLSMNPVPQLFKPALDIYANKDSFTGRPIETSGMENLSPSERATARTSQIARGLGKAAPVTGLSPVQIDHLVRGYFGWLGSHIVMTTDYALRPLAGVPSSPEARIDEFTTAIGMRGFVSSLPADQSRYITDFYEQAAKVQQAMADVRHYQKLGDAKKAKDILEDNKDAIRLYPAYRAAISAMTKVNAEIKRVEAAKLAPDAKRARLDKLRQERGKIAERVETMRKRLEVQL